MGKRQNCFLCDLFHSSLMPLSQVDGVPNEFLIVGVYSWTVPALQLC